MKSIFIRSCGGLFCSRQKSVRSKIIELGDCFHSDIGLESEDNLGIVEHNCFLINFHLFYQC